MPRLLIQISAEMDIGKREEQQDSVNAFWPDQNAPPEMIIRPNYDEDIGAICTVSDGMGGLSGGKEASQTVVNMMVSTFSQSSAAEPPGQILLRGLARAQEAVRALQHSPGDCGATLVAAIIRQGHCSFLSVGDSRIYLYRGNSLILLTRDQNRGRRIDTQIGLGRLPEEARSDKNRYGLTTYVGMESFTQADRCSQPFSVGPGDRLALLTDGVYNTLTEDEITEVMGLPEDKVASEMIKRVLAKRNPYQDNCTAAIIDCSLI